MKYRKQKKKQMQPDQHDKEALEKLLVDLNTLIAESQVTAALCQQFTKNVPKRFQHIITKSPSRDFTDIGHQIQDNVQKIVTFQVARRGVTANSEQELELLKKTAVLDYDAFVFECMMDKLQPQLQDGQSAQQKDRVKYLSRFVSYFKNVADEQRKTLLDVIVQTISSNKTVSEQIAAIRGALFQAKAKLDQRLQKTFEVIDIEFRKHGLLQRIGGKILPWRSSQPLNASTLHVMDQVEIIMLDPGDFKNVSDVPCQSINKYFPVNSLHRTQEEVTRRRDMCVAMLADGQPKCRFDLQTARCMTPEQYNNILDTMVEQVNKATTNEAEAEAVGQLMGTVVSDQVPETCKMAKTLGERMQAFKALKDFVKQIFGNKTLAKQEVVAKQEIEAVVKTELEKVGKEIMRQDTKCREISSKTATALVTVNKKNVLRRVINKVANVITAPFRWAYNNPVKAALVVSALVFMIREGHLTEATFSQFKSFLPGVGSTTFQQFRELASELGTTAVDSVIKFYDALTLNTVLEKAVEAKDQAGGLFSNAYNYLHSSALPFTKYFPEATLPFKEYYPDFTKYLPEDPAAVLANVQTVTTEFLSSLYSMVIGAVSQSVSVADELYANAYRASAL